MDGRSTRLPWRAHTAGQRSSSAASLDTLSATQHGALDVARWLIVPIGVYTLRSLVAVHAAIRRRRLAHELHLVKTSFGDSLVAMMGWRARWYHCKVRARWVDPSAMRSESELEASASIGIMPDIFY